MPVAESDKEIANKLDTFLQLLLDGLRHGSDFVSEQAPQVIQELILWKRVWFSVECAGCFILAIFLTWLFYRLYKIAVWGEPTFINIGCCTSLMGSLVLWFALPTAVYYTIMIWCAPRVYLIEYISNLVRGR